MPIDPDDAYNLNDFAITIAVAQSTIDATIKERDDLIRRYINAGAAGHTEMARECGVTRARIYQICASV